MSNVAMKLLSGQHRGSAVNKEALWHEYLELHECEAG